VIVGYARVSTDGQTLDAQQASLTAAGAEKVFSEKVSRAVTDRKALARALAALGAGDVLVVTASGSAGPQHQGPPERPRRGRQSGGGFQIAGGCLVRYVEPTWQADDNDPWWARRVREELDPRPH
jgi:hypothetical protein